MPDPKAPAFPGVEGTPGNGNSVPLTSPDGSREWVNYQPGMDIRTWIATKMAAAMLHNYDDPKQLSRQAVRFADALIAELNHPQL